MKGRFMQRLLICSLLLAACVPMAFAQAAAAPPIQGGAGANPYGPALKILFELFALAVLLESGLAVIFNWRPFLQTFDAKGVRTLVSVLVALLLVHSFNLDLTTNLVRIFDPAAPSPVAVGSILTALVLAGGSSGVNNVLVALGFRSMKTADTAVPKPPPTKAWIRVHVNRIKLAGPIDVLVKVDGEPYAIAGQITGRTPPPFLRLFLRDMGRFPSSGGLPVDPGKTYSVGLKGRDSNGNELAGVDLWGPAHLLAGAIVDIELSL